MYQAKIPQHPGVYMVKAFFGEESRRLGLPDGQVVHIGKAKDLNARITSYKNGDSHDNKVTNYVVRDIALPDPDEGYRYVTASPSAQRQLRKLWTRRRRLHVRFTQTETEAAAADLEQTLLTEIFDVVWLWNDNDYWDGKRLLVT